MKNSSPERLNTNTEYFAKLGLEKQVYTKRYYSKYRFFLARQVPEPR